MTLKRQISLFTAIFVILAMICGNAGLGFLRQNADAATDGVGFLHTAESCIIALYHDISDSVMREYSLSPLGGGFYCATRDNAARFKSDSPDIVRYIEDDMCRISCVDESTVPEPAEIPYEYGMLELDAAHIFTKGDASVIIAVIDTGIDRTDAALAGASILGGYDTVTGSNVDSDATGHGTAVSSLVYNVAPECTLMPVKVSRGTSSIYTSDFIKCLRYAADNGAKIINMSFGGYNYSYAEQEAVDYCVSKGCMLIAAAGNDGMTSLADRPNYPACYDGVVGVGAVDINGEKCEFSQEKGADIYAPGGMITLKTGGETRVENGTSYSAAFVSASAALCASLCTDCRFGTDELDFLFDLAPNSAPSAARLAELSLYPAVGGVADGGEYTSAVSIYFNRGTALLDGELIDDGELVTVGGSHILTVRYGERSVTVRFRISSAGAAYTKEYADGVLSIRFDNGSAFLDGAPYVSGTPIASHGEHYFMITHKGVTRSETFVTDGGAYVFGIEDGAEYRHPFVAYISGTAYLDGNEVGGDVYISGGEHILQYGDASMSFKVTDSRVFGSLGGMKAAVNGETVALYRDGEGGVYIYGTHDLDRLLLFISTPAVTDCAFVSGMLAVATNESIVIYDTDSGEALTEMVPGDGISASAFSADSVCYVSGNILYNFVASSGISNTVCTLGDGVYNALSFDGNNAVLYDIGSDDGILTAVDISTGNIKKLYVSASQLDRRIQLCGDRFALGKHIFSLNDGSMLYDLDSGAAIAVEDGIFICEGGACDAYSGRALSVYDGKALWATFSADTVWLGFKEDAVCISDISDTLFGGYMPLCEIFVCDGNSIRFRHDCISSAVCGERLFMTFSGDRNIYMLELDGSIKQYALLPFVPNAVYSDGNALYAAFENKSILVSLGETNTVLNTPAPVKGMAFCGGKIFMLCGDTLAELAADNTVISHPLIHATAIAATGTKLLTANRRMISAIDPETAEVLYTLRTRDTVTRILVSGDFASAGGTAFDTEKGEAVKNGVGSPLCFVGNMLFTDGGVFRYSDASLTPVSSYSSSALSAALVGNNMISFYGDRAEIHGVSDILIAEPVVGVKNGGVYSIGANAEVLCGYAYLDGNAVNGSFTVTEGGGHTLLVVMSPGIVRQYTFSIVPRLSEITFADGDITIATGEECTLRTVFMPYGSEAQMLLFESSDTDVASVDIHGNVKALSSGTATVTAYTADRMLKCSCNVKVIDVAIRFTPESGISIDRRTGTAYYLPLGMTVSELVSAAGGIEGISVIGRDGTQVTDGVISTGMTAVLISDGVPQDTLVLSVVGDINGDGSSTMADRDILSEILDSEYPPTAVERYAADINMDGDITNADLLRLNGQILHRYGFYGRNLVSLETGDTSVQLTMATVGGNELHILVSCKATDMPKYITGRLLYDTDELRFIDATSPYTDIGFRSSVGRVAFIADTSGLDTPQADIMLIRLEMLSDTASVSFEDGVSVLGDVSYRIAEASVTASCSENTRISVINALRDIVFDPTVYEYNVTLPRGSICALVSLGGDMQINGAAADGRERFDVTVAYAGRRYILHCVLSDTVIPDTNSRLSSITADGCALMPRFDPQVLEYAVELPYDAQLPGISAKAESIYASVYYEASGDTVLVGCVAEDGTSTVYSVTFIRQDEPVSSEPEPSEPVSSDEVTSADAETDGEAGILRVILIAALIAVSAAVIAVTVKKRRS